MKTDETVSLCLTLYKTQLQVDKGPQHKTLYRASNKEETLHPASNKEERREYSRTYSHRKVISPIIQTLIPLIHGTS